MEHISCNYGFQKVMVRQGRGRGKQEKKIKDCAKYFVSLKYIHTEIRAVCDQ